MREANGIEERDKLEVERWTSVTPTISESTWQVLNIPLRINDTYKCHQDVAFTIRKKNPGHDADIVVK